MNKICETDIPVISAPLWAYDETTECIKIRSVQSQRVFLNSENSKMFLLIDGIKSVDEIAAILDKPVSDIIEFINQLVNNSIAVLKSHEDSIWD